MGDSNHSKRIYVANSKGISQEHVISGHANNESLKVTKG